MNEFPYCQTTHLLYAKNLHTEKDIHYSRQLKTTAIYAADRRVLYQLIMQPALAEKINAIEKPETKKEEKPTVDKPPISSLEQEILKEALSASYNLEESVKNTEPEKFPETKPFQKEIKKDKYTFSQWMEILSKKEKSSVALMLEKLSKTDTAIKAKTDFFSPANIGRLSLIDDEKFVTETLAKIYEQQGNYQKAINAYKNLSVKYPEKNAYFASRILVLEKLLKTK